MKNKLKCILLIDDDEPTNFLNKLILKEMDCAEHIEVAQSGREAINFLTTNRLMPELVFLDVNMPSMDGWEFIDLLDVFKRQQKNKAVTIMLTTSLNPDDEVRSKTFDQIDDFRQKPLSKKMMEEILDQYFPPLSASPHGF